MALSDLTYKDAGVDIEKAAALVTDIGELRQRTEKNRKLFQPFGLFAASYDLSGYKEPVMVCGCDGVGTKLELLLKHDLIEYAGKDLVAMNVNDILTTGGDPVMFLDYVGVSALDESLIQRVVAGMVDYLESCDCILGGGETAEMPGLVKDGTLELSGFCVGIVEKPDLIDSSTVSEGDAVIGYPSAGFHANGFSLVRRILDKAGDAVSEEEVRALLVPTLLYHEEVKALKKAGIPIKAMAHITGGGFPENLERLLGGLGADLNLPRWDNDPVQKVLSYISEEEAIRTFNMGFGWVAIVPGDRVDEAVSLGHGACHLGQLRPGKLSVSIGGGT